jgi:hypothetical protein
MGSKKLGQPVPESNFASDAKSGRKHAAHTKVPSRFSWFSGLVPLRSVPASKSTSYVAAGSSFRHSSFDFASG